MLSASTKAFRQFFLLGLIVLALNALLPTMVVALDLQAHVKLPSLALVETFSSIPRPLLFYSKQPLNHPSLTTPPSPSPLQNHRKVTTTQSRLTGSIHKFTTWLDRIRSGPYDIQRTLVLSRVASFAYAALNKAQVRFFKSTHPSRQYSRFKSHGTRTIKTEIPPTRARIITEDRPAPAEPAHKQGSQARRSILATTPPTLASTRIILTGAFLFILPLLTACAFILVLISRRPVKPLLLLLPPPPQPSTPHPPTPQPLIRQLPAPQPEFNEQIQSEPTTYIPSRRQRLLPFGDEPLIGYYYRLTVAGHRNSELVLWQDEGWRYIGPYRRREELEAEAWWIIDRRIWETRMRYWNVRGLEMEILVTRDGAVHEMERTPAGERRGIPAPEGEYPGIVQVHHGEDELLETSPDYDVIYDWDESFRGLLDSPTPSPPPSPSLREYASNPMFRSRMWSSDEDEKHEDGYITRESIEKVRRQLGFMV